MDDVLKASQVEASTCSVTLLMGALGLRFVDQWSCQKEAANSRSRRVTLLLNEPIEVQAK